MQYDAFLANVHADLGLPPDSVESLTHATLRVLAERLSRQAARDLGAQLPRELQADLVPPVREAEGFGAAEFARRVARRAEVDDAASRTAAAAVLATIDAVVEPGEAGDVLAQLREEFAVLAHAGQ